MTDNELKNIVAGLAVSQAATDKLLDKAAANILAFNESMTKAEADTAALKEAITRNEVAIAALNKTMEKSEADTAALKKLGEKNDIRIEELGKYIKDLAAMYGGLGNNLGEEAELNFLQALQEAPTLAGIKFDQALGNETRNENGIKLEIDILLINGDSVAVIEVKRHLRSDHVQIFHDKTIPKFRELFPQHKDKKLYAALATYGVKNSAKPYVNKLIDDYGYALITPDLTGTTIKIDGHAMREIKISD